MCNRCQDSVSDNSLARPDLRSHIHCLPRFYPAMARECQFSNACADLIIHCMLFSVISQIDNMGIPAILIKSLCSYCNYKRSLGGAGRKPPR